jgi:hypothetical protein
MKLRHLQTIAVLSILLVAQAAAQSPADTKAGVVEKAVRALNFDQGDGDGLNRARTDFTPRGWDEFMKTMQGFLDNKGAPTFSSKFVPAGDPVIVSEESGTIRLKIPGTLTQTAGGSRTTYRLHLEVTAAGTPPKLDHLGQVTCGAASAANYCM